MTVYATRLANGEDTRDRLRRADAAGFFAQGAGLARGGLRRDGGGVVTVDAGSMDVLVSPFTAWVDGGSSDLQGGYLFVSDAQVTLTVAAGHASLPRTDVVVAEVRDNTHDASGATDARVRIVQGTPGSGVPGLPTSAVALRNITVPAGLSLGTGGLAPSNLSTDRRTYTTGLGGVLAVASQSERDGLDQTVGTVVYRTDLDELQVRRAAGWATVADNSSDSDWSGLTLASGWVGAAIRSERSGLLTVNLSVEKASFAVDELICTLPVGQRPAVRIYAAGGFGATFRPFSVWPDGTVMATAAGTNGIYGSVTFPIG